MGFTTHAVLSGGILSVMGREGVGVAHQIPLVVNLLYAVAIVTGGWLVLPKAWLALRRLQPDMNLLMSLAVLGAIGIGEWFEAATVAFLFAVSLALESWSAGRARRILVEALTGSSVEKTIRRAEEWNADLIAVGSLGHTALQRIPVGSVSYKVANEASCSVRISHGGGGVHNGAIRILIAYDGMPGSKLAVRAVVKRDWPKGTKVRLLT